MVLLTKKRSNDEVAADTTMRHERLAFMAHESNVSRAGLAKLVDSIREDGIPLHSSRATQYRARKRICRQSTRYGPLTYEVDCEARQKPVRLPIQNPFAALSLAASTSDDVARALKRALDRSPCDSTDPWRIILYQDGVDPSDGLGVNHGRNTCVLYWSFLEFERDLCREELWFTVNVTRQNNSETSSRYRCPSFLLRVGRFLQPDGRQQL